MKIDIFGASDIGCVRELNEDSFCIYGFDDGKPDGFCILSDGMGGHNAGEVASGKTVEFAAEVLKSSADGSKAAVPPRALTEAVGYANKKVYEMALEDERHNGMGATMVAAYISGTEAYIANVGDSRAYVFKNNGLVQITKDHSVVEEMVASGSLSREEARCHPQKNIITRAIGTDINTEADLFEYDCALGDCLLLCSDGLSGMLEDAEIEGIIRNADDSRTMASALIESAKEHGGTDNITVICIRFTEV